jgi:uncharacterized protein YchJ
MNIIKTWHETFETTQTQKNTGLHTTKTKWIFLHIVKKNKENHKTFKEVQIKVAFRRRNIIQNI